MCERMIEKRDKGCRTILGIHFTEQCGTISYFFHFGIHFLSKCEKRLLWSNGKGNFMIYSKEGKHKKRRKSGLRRSLLMVLSEKRASIRSVYFLRCWGKAPNNDTMQRFLVAVLRMALYTLQNLYIGAGAVKHHPDQSRIWQNFWLCM